MKFMLFTCRSCKGRWRERKCERRPSCRRSSKKTFHTLHINVIFLLFIPAPPPPLESSFLSLNFSRSFLQRSKSKSSERRLLLWEWDTQNSHSVSATTEPTETQKSFTELLIRQAWGGGTGPYLIKPSPGGGWRETRWSIDPVCVISHTDDVCQSVSSSPDFIIVELLLFISSSQNWTRTRTRTSSAVTELQSSTWTDSMLVLMRRCSSKTERFNTNTSFKL